MPSEATIKQKIINWAAGFPGVSGTNVGSGFSGTSTAGSLPGMPRAGRWTRNDVTGHLFTNLPSAGNAFMPSHPRVNRQPFEERFFQKPGISGDRPGTDAATIEVALVTNPNFIVVGTNATSALCTFNASGGVKLTTAGANNDQEILAVATTTNASGWKLATMTPAECPTFEQVVVTSSVITSQKVFSGLKLTNTPLAATDDDQAYFLYDTGNTDSTSAVNWIAVMSVAGTDHFVDTGVVVAASTKYHFMIQVDPNGIPYMFINGNMVAFGLGKVAGTSGVGVTTSAGALTAAAALQPFCGVQALTAAARNASFRYVYCEKNIV